MNKILIVGHPASGLQDVEALLHQCGMDAARPSRREGLQPQDITATLCKAHAAPPVETVVAEEDFQQIDAGPVWHGMALDLMLGNLDQVLCGWSDPEAIRALDYWKELDPKLTFVLVYDEPHRVLMEAGRADREAPTVRQMLDNWTAYNGALLRFFLRHQNRCLLVNSQQVRRAVDAYLQQLQPLLDTPLALMTASANVARPLPQGIPGSDLVANGSDDLPGGAPTSLATELPPTLPTNLALAVATLGLEPHEAAALLHTGATERYLLDGLVASHPAAQQLYAELQSAANLPFEGGARPLDDPEAAWSSLVRQRNFVSGLVAQIHAEYLRVQADLSESRQQAVADAASTRVQIAQLTEQVAVGEKLIDEHAQENELLLSQLHQVQEELELRYLRNQELEQRTSEVERENQRQIAAVRAAFEAEKSGAAKALADMHKKHEEKAKQLSGVEVQFAAEKTAAADALAEARGKLDTLAKQMGEENDLLLTQLHQVQEELERYYLDNQRLKKELSAPVVPPRYGAALRIKRQLSYRLGATMIQHSRSVGGFLSMPWALAAETRAFRKERAARPAEKLPPLHTYRDVHEAEYVKQHLSYRLGSTFLKHSRNPVGWMKLPFALRREVKQFRQQRKGAK